MQTWLHDNGLKYKLANLKADKGELNIVYNDQFCLKIYDGMGHGSGVRVNVTDKYDESVYDNDKFTWSWVFEYHKLNETAPFSRSQNDEYQHVILDIKNIVPRLSAMTSLEWNTMVEWIDKEAKKRFG